MEFTLSCVWSGPVPWSQAIALPQLCAQEIRLLYLLYIYRDTILTTSMYFTVYLGSSGVSMYHYASHYMKCCSNSLLRQHVFVRPTRNKRKRSRRMVIKAASKGDCNKVKPSSPGSLARFDESFCDTLCTDFGIPCWFLVLVCCTYQTRWDPIRIYFIPSLPTRLDILFGIASL